MSTNVHTVLVLEDEADLRFLLAQNLKQQGYRALEAGSVAEARAAGEVEIYRTRFRPMANILAGRREKMLMKLVVEPGSRRVLGCHIVGPSAAEMVQLAAVAIRMGATKDDFDSTMAVHPTAAEELVTMRSDAA